MPPRADPGVISRASWRGRRVAVLGRAAFGAAVVVGLVLVVRGGGAALRHQLVALGAGYGLLALLPVFAGTFVALLSWRASLAAVGAELPLRSCLRVFLTTQLGKYVPGSVWPLVAQMQLGRAYGVSRSRMVTGGLVALGVSVVVASGLGLVVVPGVAGRGRLGTIVALAAGLAVVLGALVLRGGALGWLLDRGMRLLRRPALEAPPDRRWLVRSIRWSLLTWALLGVHAAVLAYGLGGRGVTLLVAAAAFALASAAGVLVVFVPAGAGVREAVLVLLLQQRLGLDGATALALVSRALLAAADVLAAGVGVVAGSAAPPSAAPAPEPHMPDTGSLSL